MKKQVVVIHGGTTFNTYKKYMSFLKSIDIDLEKYKKKRWNESLQDKLGKNFEVFLLRMPNPINAKYDEWKILFNKIAGLLKNNVILIGHSLGGVVLAKYLSENKFPKKILASILIAPPYIEKSLDRFTIPNNLEKFQKQGGRIFIYYSKDDPVVPYINLEKYQKALPDAIARIFKKRGHFNQPEFPELVREIKEL